MFFMTEILSPLRGCCSVETGLKIKTELKIGEWRMDKVYQVTIKEEDQLLFKRSIRKLLESTFLLREKEERLYRFVEKESNRYDISEYLKLIGFDLLVEEKAGVAMLVANEEDEDMPGLKRANVITFQTQQYHLLLILWEVYLENLGYNEENFITRGDLIDKIKSYGLSPESRELRAAFKLFKRYSLISYDENELGEEAKIQLYPSLQFGWDLPQFQAVVEEYRQEEQEGQEGESYRQEELKKDEQEEADNGERYDEEEDLL